jgi:hypothetical protein
VVRVLPHVMRNINEFNIPSGDAHGYEIQYFGVNLILMFNYRLSIDVEVVRNSDEASDKIEILIISRKDVLAWKKGNGGSNKGIRLHYSNNGERINDVFKPESSDAYAFILSNRTLSNNRPTAKTVEVTLIHSWHRK